MALSEFEQAELNSSVISSGYGEKISLMSFIIISIIGLIAPAFLALFLPPVLFIIVIIALTVLFVYSYMRLRSSNSQTMAYIFIFTAPSSLPMILAIVITLFIPLIPSFLFSLVGIFASYFVLSGKDMLE